MTAPPSFVVPQPVATLLSGLPAYPGSMLLVSALNLGLARQLPSDVRQFLLNKKMRIHVRDARLTFDFAWTGERFAACAHQQTTDLTLSASAHDFLRLAQRQEDPDTLFFSRRMSIEGDTDLENSPFGPTHCGARRLPAGLRKKQSGAPRHHARKALPIAAVRRAKAPA